MKTELLITDPEIKPGRQIRVVKHEIANFRIHLMQQPLSRFQVALAEQQMNNTNSTVIPVNVKDLINQFNAFKIEVQFAKDHNSPPEHQYEHGYRILILHPAEVQVINNVKAKRVCMEIDLLQKILNSVDSATTQGHVSSENFVIIDEQVKTCEDAMKIWLGDGTESDTGLLIPAFKHVGRMEPDVDMDYASTQEPTIDTPASSLPDVPDTAPNK